jgi:DNA-directed RNA polymerase subunit E'/Rpb7
MDPLFERREITRNVHIDSKFLQRNIHASLLAQLRMKYEGVCIPEGFVQARSITIVDHSLGRSNLIKGGIEYNVKFQADICLPHPGQVFRGNVNLRSKIGLHIDFPPIKVLLPRDLHIGAADFDNINEGEEVEFEVVGSRFQQGDDGIVVLAKLREIIKPQVLEGVEALATSAEPMIAAPVTNDTGDKKMVTVSVEQTKPSSGGDVRRKRLRLNASSNTNEQSVKGEA